MDSLRKQFLEGITSSIEEINTAITSIESGNGTTDDQEVIFRNAHDMKGMGGSFDYPIISTIGDTLTALTHSKNEFSSLKISFIKAHMDVLHWITEYKIKTEDDPRAAPLMAALEKAKAKA